MWGLFMRSVSKIKKRKPKFPGDTVEYGSKDSDVDLEIDEDLDNDDYYYTSRSSVEEDLGSLQRPLQRAAPSKQLSKKVNAFESSESQEIV